MSKGKPDIKSTASTRIPRTACMGIVERSKLKIGRYVVQNTSSAELQSWRCKITLPVDFLGETLPTSFWDYSPDWQARGPLRERAACAPHPSSNLESLLRALLCST